MSEEEEVIVIPPKKKTNKFRRWLGTSTAKGAIARGDWINEDNVVMGTAPPLDQLEMATRPPPQPEPLTGHSFEGYRNADGSAEYLKGCSTAVFFLSLGR